MGGGCGGLSPVCVSCPLWGPLSGHVLCCATLQHWCLRQALRTHGKPSGSSATWRPDVSAAVRRVCRGREASLPHPEQRPAQPPGPTGTGPLSLRPHWGAGSGPTPAPGAGTQKRPGSSSPSFGGGGSPVRKWAPTRGIQASCSPRHDEVVGLWELRGGSRKQRGHEALSWEPGNWSERGELSRYSVLTQLCG